MHLSPAAPVALLSFWPELDLEQLLAGVEPRTAQGVVIDCTHLERLTPAMLERVLVLHQHLLQRRARTVLVAIRHRARHGGLITRLIPSRPEVIRAQLRRYLLEAPQAA